MKRLICFCTLVTLAVAPLPSIWHTIAEAGDAARDVRTLTPSEKVNLPDATMIAIQGHVVTLAQLRRFHAARLASFAHAAENGRKVALEISNQHFAMTGKGEIISYRDGAVQTLSKIKATDQEIQVLGLDPSNLGLYAGALLPRALKTVGTVPIFVYSQPILMTNSMLHNYAKDYQDFCTAARATVCLYFPEIFSWEPNSANPTFENSGESSSDIIDPLITDAQICKAENGKMAREGCHYAYPLKQSQSFTPNPSRPNGYAVNCPVDFDAASQRYNLPEWSAVADSHGAAYVEYTFGDSWPEWLFEGFGPDEEHRKKDSNPTTCVVQIFK